MVFRATLWLALGLGIAAGCSRTPTNNCEPNERYATARSAPPVQIPDDLSPPDESGALRLPPDAGAVPAPVADACLETPPPFTGTTHPGRRGAAESAETQAAPETSAEPPADPDRVIDN
jgi:uncharacterized lipoprotein